MILCTKLSFYDSFVHNIIMTNLIHKILEQIPHDTITDTEGHSTTVSIKVSNTLDYGSIPYAPATKRRPAYVGRFFVIEVIWDRTIIADCLSNTPD